MSPRPATSAPKTGPRKEPRTSLETRPSRWTIAAMVVVAVVTLLVAFMYTSTGRDALASLIEASSSTRGELRIGRIAALPPGPVVFEDVAVLSPEGEELATADVMQGYLDLSALFSGKVRLSPSEMRGAKVKLTPGPEGQVALVHASQIPEDAWGIPVELGDVNLVNNTIEIDLPGKPAMTLTSVDGLAELQLGHQFVGRLDGGSGNIELGPLDVADFRRLSGRIKSDHRDPIMMEGILDVTVAEPDFRITYHVPAIAGEKGEPRLDLDWPDLE